MIKKFLISEGTFARLSFGWTRRAKISITLRILQRCKRKTAEKQQKKREKRGETVGTAMKINEKQRKNKEKKQGKNKAWKQWAVAPH